MTQPSSNQPPIPLRVRMIVVASAAALLGGLTWIMYQRAAFLHDGQANLPSQEAVESAQIFTDEDTLEYNGYVITKTEGDVDSVIRVYSVVIYRNGKIAYQHRESVHQPKFNQFGLISLLGNGTEQVVIQQFSGGAEYCWSSWVLELADSVRFLYRSEDYPELGYELGFSDLNEDGTIELTQTNLVFDSFDRLSHEVSPFSPVYFKYSREKRRYILANRDFARHFLEEANERTKLFKAFADTTDSSKYDDSTGEYLSLVLGVVMEYVYSGQKEQGWTFFDQWYSLPDKTNMKNKIQAVLTSSRVFQELYYRQVNAAPSK